MVRLGGWLKQENIHLEIKRGLKPHGTFRYQIKNDELGQLILSFAFQKPGTSRSGKRVIFQNQNIYDQLFKVNYAQDPAQKGFILDMINQDITEAELLNSPKSLSTIPFVYGKLLSGYRGDDLERKLEHVVRDIVIIVADAYQYALNNQATTSVSNFMKTGEAECAGA